MPDAVKKSGAATFPTLDRPTDRQTIDPSRAPYGNRLTIENGAKFRFSSKSAQRTVQDLHSARIPAATQNVGPQWIGRADYLPPNVSLPSNLCRSFESVEQPRVKE